MRRFRLFLNFDKEEAWLNGMADQGHLLSKAGYALYTFSEIQPGPVVVRVDYQPSMNDEDYADYLTLFADSGWDHLSGTRRSGAQYFASFNADPDADIFSDDGSRAERYKRSLTGSSSIGLVYLVLFFPLIQQGKLNGLFSPQDWYRTPGLWDKHGLDFFRSFVFETPFVVLGVGAQILLIALSVFCVVGIVYQWILYRGADRSKSQLA